MNFQANICKTVVFIVKTLNFAKKGSQNLTLRKQSFTEVSEISIFKNLAKPTQKKQH